MMREGDGEERKRKRREEGVTLHYRAVKTVLTRWRQTNEGNEGERGQVMREKEGERTIKKGLPRVGREWKRGEGMKAMGTDDRGGRGKEREKEGWEREGNQRKWKCM